jgi:hypothetical protein
MPMINRIAAKTRGSNIIVDGARQRRSNFHINDSDSFEGCVPICSYELVNDGQYLATLITKNQEFYRILSRPRDAEMTPLLRTPACRKTGQTPLPPAQ